MNKITTKVLSLLSVFAILLTMLPASFTAFATETKVQIENADGYGITTDITIGDGYVIHAREYWCMIHTADSKRAVYCLEPGKSVSSGDKYNEDAAGEYLQSVNNKILDAAEIQSLLGRVFLYGFTGNLDSVDAYYRYIATQLLVWEVIVGQRDMNFNRVSNGDTSVETALTKFRSSYAAKMVSGYYYDYESAIKNHLKSVSFASYSESLAVHNAMQSDADGTYTFTDTNGVLSAFDVSVKNGSVVSKSGNSLTVQAENGKTAIVTLTQNNVNASGELTGFLTLTNDSKQTLAELQASPRTYYAAVKGLQKFTVEVTKQDSETISAQGDATLSGAVYGLYCDGELLDEYVTDENGCFKTKEYVCGNYTIREISPSKGYLLDDTVYLVGAEPEHYTLENNSIPLNVEETVIKGNVSILKHSDDDENEIVNLEAGAEFEVYLKSAGSYGDAKDSERDYLITDENGYAESDLLYLGKYEIKEISAPYGYVLNKEPQTVELTYAGQTVAVRDSVKTSFTNDYQGVEMTLSKFMEQDELFGIGMNDEWRSVCFGLFADENITAADDTVIPENGLICEVCLDETMTAVIAEKLPFGRYYVQEIATDEHYVLNGEKYLVHFEYQGQEVTTVNIDCSQFVNNLKRGKVEGIKTNESGEPLEDAVFGLFIADSETAMMTTVSDENGYFAFTDIPYGEYVVIEIEAPTGYILSDELYPVTIAEDGDIIEITAENQPITVEISKQDVHGNELEGAEMQLIDSKGNVVDEWTSDGKHHVVTELPVGSYNLKEIAAPDGYVIATDIGFEIFADGSVVLESSEIMAISDDGYLLVVMVDEATKVQISKQDATTGEELPGATLQVIDENDEVVEEWISTNAPHLIEAILITGNSYTLREITAPDGYEIAEDMQFTVNTDGTITEVVMKDAPTPKAVTPVIPITPPVLGSPATGDIGTNPLAYVLIATGVLGLVLTIRRKKK